MPKKIILSDNPYKALQTLNPHGLLLVVPNKEAAHTLNVPYQSLDKLCRKILTANNWMVANPLVAHRCLKQAVAGVLNPRDVAGKARSFALTVRQILLTGRDLTELDVPSIPRFTDLVAVANQYRQILQARNLLDPGEMFWAASGLSKERVKVAVYGYPSLGSDLLKFIDGIADEGSLILLPGGSEDLFKSNREAAEYLVAKGWTLETLSSGAPSPSQKLAEAFMGKSGDGAQAEAEAWAYPTIEAEVRGTLARIKRLLHNGVNHADIALVSRDGELYGPVVRAVASEYGISIRLSYEVPLNCTQLGFWISCLREIVLADFPFEATSAFLRHPFCNRLSAQAWEAARKSHSKGLSEWKESVGGESQLLDDLVWPERDLRQAYVDRLNHLLHRLRVFNRAKWWGQELNALGVFQEMLHVLNDSPDMLVSGIDFFEELTEAMGTLSANAGGGYAGIAFNTPLAMYGACYEHVFVLGAAEGCLPAPVRNDAVLDFHDRLKLAESASISLEGAMEAASSEELSFLMILLAVGQRLSLSFPRLMENQSKLPSAFLTRLGLEPKEAESLPAASIPESRQRNLRLENDPVMEFARHSWEVESGRLKNEDYDEFDGMIGLPVDATRLEMSPSQLASLGECHFKWLARHGLGLREPDEAEDEVSAATLGTFYHKILELAATVEEGPRPDNWRAYMLDRLETTLDQVALELGMTRFPLWEARRADYLRTLRQAIQSESFIDPDADIIEQELEFSNLDWFGFLMNGKIDRLDRLPNGLFLIDYKTGSSITKVKNEENKPEWDIQLPIYESAVNSMYPDEPVVGKNYFSINQAKNLISRQKQISSAQLQPFAERMHRVLTAGAFTVSPDEDGKVCKYCDYTALCRRGIRLHQKKEQVYAVDE